MEKKHHTFSRPGLKSNIEYYVNQEFQPKLNFNWKVRVT